MNASFFSNGGLLSWMMYSLLLSVLITAAAMLAHDAQRAANRAIRWTWFSAIVVIVSLTFAAPVRRSTVTNALTSATTSQTAIAVPAWLTPEESFLSRAERTFATLAQPLNATITLTQRLMTQVPTAVQRGLAITWALASFVTLCVFVISYVRMRGMVRRWPKLAVAGTMARIAPSSGPAVIGLAPSEIVVPSWLLSRTADEQQLVVTHENEHVQARDPWLLVLACGAIALMPWNPLLWYAFGRLQLAIELDCDRRVLQRGVRTADYGALLIDLSSAHTAFPSAVPAFVVPAFSCTGSYLERRLLAMTSRPSRFATSRRAVGGVLATLAVVTACESKLPTSAEIDKMDAKSAVAQAGYMLLRDTSKILYVVDGKQVSASAAQKLAAEQIEMINVTKAGGDGGVVTLRTKSYTAVADTSALKRKQGVEIAAQGADGGGLIRTRVKGVALAPTEAAGGQMKRKFDGLLVIDGKVADASLMETMSPEKILSVEVVKGAAAMSKYTDPRAANGVILVTMKK